MSEKVREDPSVFLEVSGRIVEKGHRFQPPPPTPRVSPRDCPLLGFVGNGMLIRLRVQGRGRRRERVW